ncbi:MAG: hypothetical protein NC489_47015 [Ruminococcus flavefaciens]|nr:hypothetical protein [Ruminococcus flavefaciens]
MDDRQPNQINRYLMPDEYVLWDGRPGSGRLFTKYDICLIPFSILWCGFAIFWETSVLLADTSLLSKLWGIPFVCVGLYLVFGRFFMKFYIRKQTVYVITNRRIFSFFKNRVSTIDYHICPAKTVTRYPDGSGNIFFTSAAQPNIWGTVPGRFPDQNFFALDNVPDVDRILQILSTPS